MPNIAAILKVEIVRLARRELRAEVEGWKKSLAGARSEIVGLKRRVQELEKAARKSARVAQAAAPPVQADGLDGSATRHRFRAAGLASNRNRLGLSAADFGLLTGATAQSVYAWEHGKSRPAGAHLQAIAALRGVGKREVASRLAGLKAARPRDAD